MWLVYSSQRRYVVEGSEKDADEVRRSKARWHGCVFRKRPVSAEEAARVLN